MMLRIPLRQSRFIKSIATSSVPQVVISLSVGSLPTSDVYGLSQYDFSLSDWSMVVRKNEGRESRLLERRTGKTADSFWSAISKYCQLKRKTWVVSHDVKAHFRLLDGWIRSDDGRVDWGDLKANARENTIKKRDPCVMILGTSVTVLCHKFRLGYLQWVDYGNYLPFDTQEIANRTGVEINHAKLFGDTGESFSQDTKNTAIAIDAMFHGLMSKWIREDCGHWQWTSAMLSHQLWRRRHYDEKILEHFEPDAAQIERQAIYGGRAEVLYFGRVSASHKERFTIGGFDNPVSNVVNRNVWRKYDIRSMYASLLRDRKFPVALDRRFGEIKIDELLAKCRLRCAVAKVDVAQSAAIAPLREEAREYYVSEYVNGRKQVAKQYNREKTLYPTGNFTTFLYGPELEYLIGKGFVTKVHYGFTYRPGRPFKSFATACIDERKRARESDDATGDVFWKLISNAFAGKFASRSGGWQHDGKKAPLKKWGEWFEADYETGESTSYRAIAGVVQKYVKQSDEPKGVPSVFGYLTSYGRVLLHQIVESAGRRNVAWYDTDGIIVSQDGEANLKEAGFIGSGEAGKLRYEHDVWDWIGFDAKHYRCNGNWTLAGFGGADFVETTGQVVDHVKLDMSELMHKPLESTVGVSCRQSTLNIVKPSCEVSERGWLIPVHLGNQLPKPSDVILAPTLFDASQAP